MTAQRERVLEAVRQAGHATPDEVFESVRGDGGAHLSLSTVYRNLDVLERVGLISHTHLEHRAPTYHLADHANHVHLVCKGCGQIGEAPVRVADRFAAEVSDGTGFVVDARHMTVHGWCGACGSGDDGLGPNPVTPGTEQS